MGQGQLCDLDCKARQVCSGRGQPSNPRLWDLEPLPPRSAPCTVGLLQSISLGA